MKKTNYKIKIFSLLTVAMILGATNAYASEQTGTLCTGLNCPIEGIVMVSPIASPIAGTYTSTQSVTLIANGATSIRYTDDSTTPTCASTQYLNAISIASSKTITAVFCYPNNQSSSVVSFAYTINIPTTTTTFVPSSGGGGGATAPIATTPTPTPTPAPVGQVLGVATFNFTANLRLGTKGDAITELQKRLTAEGVYSGPITGYFGQLTLAGVKAYQNKYGISQTGTVGPLTRGKLNASQVAGVSTANIEAIRTQIASLQAQLLTLLQQLSQTLQAQVKQ